MFDRQSPSITGITFLFHPTKRWKILCLIIALAVVTLSRFQCIPQVDWKIYPFPSSIFNSNWWYYPYILTLFVNKALWFKFLSDGKKIISPCFTICFAKVIPWVTMRFHEKCYTKKNVCLSNIAKEGQWDFFNHSNIVVLTEEQRWSSESFQTGTIPTEKCILLLLNW